MHKVLVAPLDWGLGHATRCIPVIRELSRQGVEVMISASFKQKALLEPRFPSATFTDIPGYDIRYPEKGSMALAMLNQSGSVMRKISIEHKALDDLITKTGITHVISDNRYGLWSSKAKTAFITHQVHIEAPLFIRQLLFTISRSFIEKFDRLWIPDTKGPANLSGRLSDIKGIRIPIEHLGPLSRFSAPSVTTRKVYDCIALLSGPEPQRTLLEEKLLLDFPDSGQSLLLIRGLPGETTGLPSRKGIEIRNHIEDGELAVIMHPETLVVCRPGYSTLMDLVALKHKKVFFIPTPGQTEQQYLATYWCSRFGQPFASQKEFKWDSAFIPANGSLPEDRHSDPPRLSGIIEAFLGK